MKEERLYIRLKKEDKDYLNKRCRIHNCSKTQLIIELIRQDEYIELNYDGIDQFNRVFGNIGTNINQMARALNIIKMSGDMSNEQYQMIMEIFEKIKKEYEIHQLYSHEMLKKIYRVKRKKIKYKN